MGKLVYPVGHHVHAQSAGWDSVVADVVGVADTDLGRVRCGRLSVRGVALDELGDLVRSLLGQVVPAVLENLDLHVGPAVVGSKVLGQSRHDRAEDVLAADEQQGDVDGGGALTLSVMLAGRAR